MKLLLLASLTSAALTALNVIGERVDAVPSAPLVDTVRYRVAVSVDEENEPRAAELGEIFGLAVDSNGDMYVADLSNAIVVVFGRDGKFRGTVGRKGRGPGEFQAPTGIVIDQRNDRLWVRDTEHVIRFVRDARTKLLAKYDSATRQPMYPDWRSPRASRLASDGSYLHVAPSAMRRAVRFVLQYALDGRRVDSIHVPHYANTPVSSATYMLSANSGRMLRGLNHVPFAAVPQWDVTPLGTIVSGDAMQYRIVETTARGARLREFSRIVRQDPIPRQELQDSARALRRRIDSIPVPLERVEGMPDDVRNGRLPTSYPAYQAIFAEVDGTIWVRRWPNAAQRGQSVFDVFDSERRYVRSVLLPIVIANAPTPVLRAGYIAAVAVNESTGVQSIVRFEPVVGR